MRCGSSRRAPSRATRGLDPASSRRRRDARSADASTASRSRSSSRPPRSGTLGVENLRDGLSKRVVLLADGPARPARPAADPPRHARLEHRPPLAGGAHAVRAAGGLLRRLHRSMPRWPSPAEQPNRSPPSRPTACCGSPGGSELRFSMLETVRDHALELLDRSGGSRRGAERARRVLREPDRAHRAPRRGDQHATPADRPRHRQLPRRDGLVRARPGRTARRCSSRRASTTTGTCAGCCARGGVASADRSTAARAARRFVPWPCAPWPVSTSCSATSRAPRSGHERESRRAPRPERRNR